MDIGLEITKTNRGNTAITYALEIFIMIKYLSCMCVCVIFMWKTDRRLFKKYSSVFLLNSRDNKKYSHWKKRVITLYISLHSPSFVLWWLSSVNVSMKNKGHQLLHHSC